MTAPTTSLHTAPFASPSGGVSPVPGAGSAGSAGKIAGAPISWGVCEVPGWGYQLSPERVLAEMTQVGLAATELGPAGFLPNDPAGPRPSCGSTTWHRSAASSRSSCTCRVMTPCRRSRMS